jgi:UDP-GlcNAc3NAcA epimerase
MKILTVVGARPQFIKAAVVSAVFNEKEIEEILLHTGQHYDKNMSEIFFKQMGIPHPKYNLNIKSNTHGSMTGRMLEGIEEILLKERPEMLLVYGDTNSTLAAALAARKLNIPIAHVEAGLRNFDFSVPEDVNRTITDRISDLIFCPTETAIENLLNEGFDNFPCKVVKTGDLMADSVSLFKLILKNNLSSLDPVVLGLPTNSILLTIHRQETTKPEVIKDVVKFLNEIAKDKIFIFPMHPRTRSVVKELNLVFHDNIHVIEPVGYLEMQYLLSKCNHVITDSGGLQKEAYLHCKPSLLLMNFTPWVELVQNYCSVTTELNYEDIKRNYKRSLCLNSNFNSNLYGDGNSRYQIVNEIIKYNYDKL